MRKGRSAAIGLVLATGVVVVSACSSGGSASSSPAGDRRAGTGATSSSAFRVGSSGGYATFQAISENRRFLDHAVSEIERRCMQAAGFRAWVVLDRPKKYSDPARPLTVKDARSRGYHSLDPPPDLALSNEQDAYFATLTDAQQQQYQHAEVGDLNDVYKFHTFLGDAGYPRHGCAGMAVSEITDQPAEYNRLQLVMSNLTSAPEYRPNADPGLNAPLARWRTCMKKSNYDFKTPQAAEVAGGRLDVAYAKKNATPEADGTIVIPDTPSPAALALAIADARCRVSSGWNDAYARAVHNALAVVIDAHQSDVLAWEDLSAAAVKKAKAVLSK